jgi:hypothetical protein
LFCFVLFGTETLTHQALSVDTVITLLAALLTEQKILFHSQHYVLLITVLQSLIDLLLPFQWPHTYIPTGKKA